MRYKDLSLRVTFAPPVCAGSKTAKKMPTILGKNDLDVRGDGQVSSDGPSRDSYAPPSDAFAADDRHGEQS